MGRQMEVRQGSKGPAEKGSNQQRTIELVEAEAFGEELASNHVNVDESSLIQWYDNNIGMDHKFHLLGWWALSGQRVDQ